MQLDAYRRMTPAERLRVACELSVACRELARAGIRSRHPGAPEAEIRLRLAALTLDRETMIRLFDWDPRQRGY